MGNGKTQTKPPAEGYHQIVVRLPVSLHTALKARADEREVSVNAQVRHVIERDLKAAA